MEVLKTVNLFLVLMFCVNLYVKESIAVCLLNLRKDFGNPSPVYLQNGEFLAPNLKGEVSIRRAGKITVACPGNRRFIKLDNDTTEFEVLEARCKSKKTFAVGPWTGDFKNITCSASPFVTTEEAGSCSQGSTLHKVGFKILNKFHALYEACFNKELLSTSYVKHDVRPTGRDIQGENRPLFFEGSLFGKVRMSEAYKNKNQRDRLNAVLGPGMDQHYMSKNQFLTRGHLAPRGDYPLHFLQRATFHYVNSAPQWLRSNAGDWAALEDALRRRATSLNTSLVVYTGTIDVLLMPDSHGRDTPLYLTVDGNNNGIVPVPLYFFKLVYDSSRKAATAFVNINSSFYNSSRTEQLTFCDNTCEDREIPWLRWRADGAHSFCCTYKQFKDKATFLPKLDVQAEF